MRFVIPVIAFLISIMSIYLKNFFYFLLRFTIFTVFFFKGTYNCCFAFVLRELVADCGRVLNPLLIIPASDSS